MKISIDDEIIANIDEKKLKIIAAHITTQDVKENVKRAVSWALQGLVESHVSRLKSTWMPKLFQRYETIPTSDEKLIDLIFCQEDYFDQEKKERDL